ncbi:alpha/beta hydrolase [Myroides albus]|uniref:Alpha/beta fold hydrolase n=1 Tax=Myroides albus TaxID=2562892 RepID=A0A6I3LGC8_9FLAO|nr:alpha/beta hydrolase [Myroides albus]MTG97538.1 alpha/beta fold hydrolase [Myroides albus]UVD81185.1 alpha/beta hydrolase [Myroides albus]
MIHKSLTYKNIALSYCEQGQGEPIIFLHGFLATANMWEYFTKHFSRTHQVFSVDLLGHGQSECLGYIHSMEDMADAVYAIVQENQLENLTIVGHSMGGYVALAFGELYPDIVNKIILVASTSAADSAERKANRDRSISIIKKNSATFIKMALSNLFTDENRINHHTEIDNAIIQALQLPVQGVIAALEGMKERTDREVLLHFAPYTINMIFGEYDTVMPLENTLQQLQGTTIEHSIIKGGHMLHIDSKELLLQSLDTFINKKAE